jgi:hypothetical protein
VDTWWSRRLGYRGDGNLDLFFREADYGPMTLATGTVSDVDRVADLEATDSRVVRGFLPEDDESA